MSLWARFGVALLCFGGRFWWLGGGRNFLYVDHGIVDELPETS